MEPGNYAAYNQLTPLQGNISDELNKQALLNAEKKKQKLAEDEFQYKKDKDLADKHEKLIAQIKAKNPYDTGSQSKNEFQAKMLSQVPEELGKLIPIIENPSNYPIQDVVKARIKFQNLNNIADNMQAMDKGVTDYVTKVKTDVANKKIWENPKFNEHYQAGYSNKVPIIDENGLPGLAFIDENNDGIDDVTGKERPISGALSYSNMENGVDMNGYKFMPRYDKEELLKDSLNKIQPDDVQLVGGKLISETKKLDQKKAQEHVANLFYNPDGTPTPQLQSLAKENNVSLSDEKGLDDIYNSYVNEMNLRTPNLYKETPNPEWDKTREFNYKVWKDAKDDVKPTIGEAVETPQIYKDAGVKPADGYKTIPVSDSEPIPSVQLYVHGKKKDITNATVNSYTVSKDKLGRRIVYCEVSYQDSKSSTLTPDEMAEYNNPKTDAATKELLVSKIQKGAENKSVVGYLAQKDADKFARQIGFKNTSKMANHAKVSEEKDTRPKTVVQNGHTYTLNTSTGKYE